MRAILLNNMGALNISRTAIKILAGLTKHQLRLEANKFGHCAVYKKELRRVWPSNEKDRKTKIEQFAKEHGFRLAYHRDGFCAIFEELPVESKLVTIL